MPSAGSITRISSSAWSPARAFAHRPRHLGLHGYGLEPGLPSGSAGPGRPVAAVPLQAPERGPRRRRLRELLRLAVLPEQYSASGRLRFAIRLRCGPCDDPAEGKDDGGAEGSAGSWSGGSGREPRPSSIPLSGSSRRRSGFLGGESALDDLWTDEHRAYPRGIGVSACASALASWAGSCIGRFRRGGEDSGQPLVSGELSRSGDQERPA